MPLNTKGRVILAAMQRTYGVKKGKSVFYASENGGTITGVTAAPAKKKPVRRRTVTKA